MSDDIVPLRAADPEAVIAWIENELNEDDNFRDIPEILAEARERFARSTPGADS